ncbi:MAG: (4Fe-4S)-binding protein [Candidatus Aenigmarchaeota archaeon ex4484_224]|nr:MAG: (4Fe-4S)-binding protein [Candidatus Aenigmarchaeota archaeon ex4484_224]
MKIAVVSGKGGVGKSMIASSFAILFSKRGKKIVACDCDVDAPNMAIWLGIRKSKLIRKVKTSKKSFIKNQKEAKKCNLDPKICKFGAISLENGKYKINRFLCEGCGLCNALCPKGFGLKDVENAEIRIVNTKFGFPLIFAQLYPGETGSGKIVDETVKEAEKFDHEIMIIDSSAGVGCPVNASLKVANYAIIVVEPSLSSYADMKRVLRVIKYFGIEFFVLINKFNLNEKVSKKIENEFKDRIIGKISYSEKLIDCLSKFKTAFCDEKIKKEIEKSFENFLKKLNLK